MFRMAEQGKSQQYYNIKDPESIKMTPGRLKAFPAPGLSAFPFHQMHGTILIPASDA